jgi:predicted secreted hydrolase
VKTSSAASAVLSLVLLAGIAVPADAPRWLDAAPGYAWEFPRDHWSHPGYRTEWWYFTGQLAATGEAEPRFGYQFTFFRVGLVPRNPEWVSGWSASDIIMGHAAVTDLRQGEHRFTELVYRATPLLGGFSSPGDSLIAWSVAPSGSRGRWTLAWNGRGFDIGMRDETRGLGLELRTTSTLPPVLQGEAGWSRKNRSGTASSLYYSMPRLATGGTVRFDGQSVPVEGESWMDKEFGSSQLGEGQVGWDWFALRLEDGRSLMLYRLRRADGSTDWRSGTVIRADGSSRSLEAEEWTLSPRGTWKSAVGNAEYPSGWTLEVAAEGLRLTITPDLPDQENRSRILPGLQYWEGSVSVADAEDRHMGRGHVELTGYGADSRPPHLGAAKAAERPGEGL